MKTARRTPLLALVALTCGCPGDMSSVNLDSGPGPAITTLDGSNVPPAPLDVGVQPEAAPQPADLGAPPPDVIPQNGPGEPCPCKPGLQCFAGVCREMCTRQGLCDASSSCPAGFGCVEASCGEICLPAVGAGEGCGNGVYCGNNHTCAVHNGSAPRCVPVCNNVGGGCGNGGTCANSGANCNVCTSP